MRDDEVLTTFGEVAAENPTESVRHEHEAVDRVEVDAEAAGVLDDSDLLPDQAPDEAPDDFRDATARTVGDPPHAD